jgi:hypothetical protein
MVAEFYYDFFYKYHWFTFILPPLFAFIVYYLYYLPLFRKTSWRLRNRNIALRYSRLIAN